MERAGADVCQSFAPIVDAQSRILILGSMPGVRSLTEQQYYAHPRNRFWQLLSLLVREPLPLDYAAKQALLHRQHIALWDTLGYCERRGSLDSDIRSEVPNRICELLQEYPGIEAIACNGGKAAATFKKYFAKGLPRELSVYYFHSTSPANARMGLEDLAGEWQEVMKHLDGCP